MPWRKALGKLPLAVKDVKWDDRSAFAESAVHGLWHMSIIVVIMLFVIVVVILGILVLIIIILLVSRKVIIVVIE